MEQIKRRLLCAKIIEAVLFFTQLKGLYVNPIMKMRESLQERKALIGSAALGIIKINLVSDSSRAIVNFKS